MSHRVVRGLFLLLFLAGIVGCSGSPSPSQSGTAGGAGPIIQTDSKNKRQGPTDTVKLP